jgi:alpha-galactosidase
VHFNTWEACYFAQDEERVLRMVRTARDLGIERFVLDDGWFAGRKDDTAGLGDWRACEIKYPSGLTRVAAAVKDAGMEFGLWIEPEMVSPDSDLYRQHPDWVVEVADLEPVLGRNQKALNLCIPAAFDHVLATLSELVDDLGLDCIKWDMNRDLTHAFHQGKPVGHELTMAFYRMVEQLRQRFPALEIEVCASDDAEQRVQARPVEA